MTRVLPLLLALVCACASLDPPFERRALIVPAPRYFVRDVEPWEECEDTGVCGRTDLGRQCSYFRARPRLPLPPACGACYPPPAPRCSCPCPEET